MLGDKGKLIKFKENEDKMPALVFKLLIKMWKIKKSIYSPSEQTKKDIAKLQAEIKLSIQKLENESKKKNQKFLMIICNLYKQ